VETGVIGWRGLETGVIGWRGHAPVRLIEIRVFHARSAEVITIVSSA
jgi:hypothetical protein